MKPLSKCQLYTFIDTAYLASRSPITVAKQLCDGGSDVIQLRAKKEPKEELRRMAAMVLPILDRAGVPLVINDSADVAAEVGAHFCHLGQEDFFDNGYSQVAEVIRKQSRKAGCLPLEVGLSTHAPHEASRAIAANPAYVAIGPVFPTPTKPTAKAVTLDYVRWAAHNVSIPWFAIGGINLTTLDEVLAAGARRICVVSAILNSQDVLKACQAFRDRLPCAL